jgi:uncharacterized repeat protein (TIGR03803 family)
MNSRTMNCRTWMLAVTLVAVAGVGTLPAQSQTYAVLHSFAGNEDGANPLAGVILDSAGNLYGDTSAGGRRGYGTVFQLAQSGSGWSFSLLYTFQGLSNRSNDGAAPYARLAFGPDGALYGTTHSGGDGEGCRQLHGCGTVFRLKPLHDQMPGPWQESVLHQFGTDDGSNPDRGDVVFDAMGNLYGTTRNGGVNGGGTVFELSRAGDSWTESVLHSFAGAPDGSAPLSGPAFDRFGNLYGTTIAGGSGWGTVYRLSHIAGGWTETVLHRFQNGIDGLIPATGIVFDRQGNLYGATQTGGSGGGGTLFELLGSSDGSWSLNSIYQFAGFNPGGASHTLLMDGVSRFYGTTSNGGTNQQGAVFQLTRLDGGWAYTSLHDFTGGEDGAIPYGDLALDANGNVYGTTYAGGVNGNGVVFQIAP